MTLQNQTEWSDYTFSCLTVRAPAASRSSLPHVSAPSPPNCPIPRIAVPPPQDWDAMMADIAKTDNTRQCDMITAGIHIVAALMDSGIRFSAPTYSGERMQPEMRLCLATRPFLHTHTHIHRPPKCCAKRAGGSQIMIYAPAADDIFAFLKPFSAGVWLAIFATSAFVATFATFMEVPLRRMARNPRGASHKWMNLQWASAAMLLQVCVAALKQALVPHR